MSAKLLNHYEEQIAEMKRHSQAAAKAGCGYEQAWTEVRIDILRRKIEAAKGAQPEYRHVGKDGLWPAAFGAEEAAAINDGKWLDSEEFRAALDAGLEWMTRPFASSAGAFGHPALLAAVDEYDTVWPESRSNRMSLAEFLRRQEFWRIKGLGHGR